jgi:hypothetical protein
MIAGALTEERFQIASLEIYLQNLDKAYFVGQISGLKNLYILSIVSGNEFPRYLM